MENKTEIYLLAFLNIWLYNWHNLHLLYILLVLLEMWVKIWDICIEQCDINCGQNLSFHVCLQKVIKILISEIF